MKDELTKEVERLSEQVKGLKSAIKLVEVTICALIFLLGFIIGVQVGRWDKRSEVRTELAKCKPGQWVTLHSVDASCDAFGRINVYDKLHK